MRYYKLTEEWKLKNPRLLTKFDFYLKHREIFQEFTSYRGTVELHTFDYYYDMYVQEYRERMRVSLIVDATDVIEVSEDEWNFQEISLRILK